VFRIVDATKQKPGAPPDHTKIQLIIKDLPRPNGIAFSPDEKILYIADSGKHVWLKYPVNADGTVGAGTLFGSGPGGVWILSPEGKHLGTVKIPEVVSNVAWGDADGKTLYITASTGLYRIKLNAAGVRN